MPTPQQIESSLERALEKAPEPPSFKGDAAAVLKVLRRWYGDDAGAILRAALEQWEGK